MMYAVISEKDNQTRVLHILRVKRYHKRILFLYQTYKINTGIKCWGYGACSKCRPFSKCRDIYKFCHYTFKTDVSMKILEQPYLDIVNGKRYKFGIEGHLKALAELEHVNINRLIVVLKCNSTGNQYIYTDV